MTYNGWTNYETWAVGLYLDGNYDGEGTYHTVLDLAREHASDAREDGRDVDDALYTLAEALSEYVEGELMDVEGYALHPLASDLLGAALSEVNWRELAEAKLAEIQD